jgi:hypothetical protein
MVRALETWLCIDLQPRKENAGSTDIPIIPLRNVKAVVLKIVSRREHCYEGSITYTCWACFAILILYK